LKISDWLSERILFGTLIIVSYLAVCLVGSVGQLTPAGESVVHDAMLGLGPIVGLIAAAIWKSDKADKQNASTMASLASTVAAQTPSTSVTVEAVQPGPQSQPTKGT
jgi:hypothetical protein